MSEVSDLKTKRAQAEAALAAAEQAKAEIARIDAELVKHAEKDAEVQAFAKAQGVPVDVAAAEIQAKRAEAAKTTAGGSVLQMSPRAYQKYKQDRGIY